MSGMGINFDDQKMSNLTIKERKSKFNKLSNSLNIKIIKGDQKSIQYMVDYIKTKPIDLSNKNKCMAYCSELLLKYYLILAT